MTTGAGRERRQSPRHSPAAALDWMDAERLNLLAAITMAADTGRDQVAMWLPFCLGLYFHRRRRFDDQLAAATVSLAAAQRLGDRRNEAVALTNLGTAFSEQGRHGEAIAILQRAAAAFREMGNQLREAMALGNLGAALSQEGRSQEAITAIRDAAAIYRAIGGRNREGGALNNLGLALRDAGRPEDAISGKS